MNKIIHYIQFFVTFIIAQSFSMWGQYYTLKFPNMGMLEAFARAIPFAWADWFFMTIAVGIGHKHKLVTPTQDTFILIITQFTLLLLINKFYLKQELSNSDLIAFFIILIGFAVSFFNLLSKSLGYSIPKKEEENKESNKSV